MFYRAVNYGFIVAVLLLASAIGCKSPGLPVDPLLVSRKPLKADFAKPTPLVAIVTEPPLPQLPTAYLAARAREIKIHDTSLDAYWPIRSMPSMPPGVLTNHPRTDHDTAQPKERR